MAITQARAIDVANVMVAEIQGIAAASGLDYTARRVYSFGFTDGDLSTLRVVCRPYDIQYADESRQTEEDNYEIQFGLMKSVSRTDVAGIDRYVNLFTAIMALYPIARNVTVGTKTMIVVEKRPFPFMFRSDTIMDSTTPTTRYDARGLITFREWVDE